VGGWKGKREVVSLTNSYFPERRRPFASFVFGEEGEGEKKRKGERGKKGKKKNSDRASLNFP